MCLIMSGAAVPAVAGPYEDALASYDKGDYVTTLRVWRPFAEQGDPTPRTARTSNPAIDLYVGAGFLELAIGLVAQ